MGDATKRTVHDPQPHRCGAPFMSLVGASHWCNRRVGHERLSPECRCRCGHNWPTSAPAPVEDTPR